MHVLAVERNIKMSFASMVSLNQNAIIDPPKSESEGELIDFITTKKGFSQLIHKAGFLNNRKKVHVPPKAQLLQMHMYFFAIICKSSTK